MRRLSRSVLPLAALMCLFAGGEDVYSLSREPTMAGIRVYYGPGDGFSRIDPQMIETARTDIDLAAYVLSDRDFIDALRRAAGRGVKLRIYLDPNQPGARRYDPASNFALLINSANVDVRFKAPDAEIMHMKSYQIDGRILRSGSANFSASGVHGQDNDIVVVESRAAAAGFKANFESVWHRPDNERTRP
jgi:phosphatidylserine/phosphatidylglycerophosphate/cardiolipin synthase-like enzyme